MKLGRPEIKCIVNDAFGSSTPPDASQLVRGNNIEALQVKDFFAGKYWQEITLRSLQHDYIGDGGACLWFMTPAAVAYYFPAYLLIACLDYFEADAISGEFVSKLVRSARGEPSNISDALGMMTPSQNAAIAYALDFIYSNYESEEFASNAKVALDLRWRKLLDHKPNSQ